MELTNEQKFEGRRNFLKAAAALPAVGAFALANNNVGPVKAGIVGTGMEGRVLIDVINPKYINIKAICDIRPDNMIQGTELIKKKGHGEPTQYTNYEDMLEDPELEAIICATPLHLHAPVGVAAMNAGKHYFTEKTMAFDVDECVELCKIAQQKNLNLQVGHQRFYNPLYWDAYRMMSEGLLGNVYHMRALWHRNTDWNYWIHVNPELKEMLMKEFDPTKYGYEDHQHIVNWRWYEATSRGLWTELCSHQLAITNWLWGDQAPSAVQAFGGQFKTEDDFKFYNKVGYEKDTRTVDDHIYAIFEYPEGRTVTYSAIQSNRFDDYYEQIMGTFGTIILSKENQYYLFWEPGWDEEKAKDAAAGGATAVSVKKEEGDGSAFAAHVTGGATAGGGGAGDFTPYAPYGWELEGFAHTIRTGAPNLCSGVRGLQAAQAVFAGREALKTKQRQEIPDLTSKYGFKVV